MASYSPSTPPILSWDVSADQLIDTLGPAKYNRDHNRPHERPGLANGLAWTAAGGTLLHIEAARTQGSGKLKVTGNLGDVMRESVEAALTALRVQHCEELKSTHTFKEYDLHVHFPEGATPKDGPSAGVTLYCALYSLMSESILNAKVAMTGECTLQGRILPVGGLKEKLLAAQREGMTRLILPLANQSEVLSFEDEVRGDLELIWVTQAEEALKAALPS